MDHQDLQPRRSCPHCGGDELHRSRRRRLDRILSIIGLLPYRCSDCCRRFYRF
jgi:hypothetical protein